MFQQSLYQTYHRFKSLQTHFITTLPIVILMPHSACNCKCIMCDIWKGNNNIRSLTELDIIDLLFALKELQTKQVVLSGGEALLHSNFFNLCNLLKKEGLSLTLLSTGISLEKYASELVHTVDEIILSLDGDEKTHNRIRNIPTAFQKLRNGINAILSFNPNFNLSVRTVVHKHNYKILNNIINTAKSLNVKSISFLPADVTSNAFNRSVVWNQEKQSDILIPFTELHFLHEIIEKVIMQHQSDFENRFIVESPDKLRKIYTYYSAQYGLNEFPYKKCNAPWVSAVIEPDGNVKPCFFHAAVGNIKSNNLMEIINNEHSIQFRKNLNVDENHTCKKCVCYLNLKPHINPVAKRI